jgi:hypothetical protein
MNKIAVINVRYQKCIILLKHVYDQLHNHTKMATGFDDMGHIQASFAKKYKFAYAKWLKLLT